jgi:hypothetical protein
MKKYTTDMIKLIAIVVLLPLLVMAYTTIEKKMTAPVIDQKQESLTKVNAVTTSFIDVPAKLNTGIVKDQMHKASFVNNLWQHSNKGTINEKIILQNGCSTTPFCLLLL